MSQVSLRQGLYIGPETGSKITDQLLKSVGLQLPPSRTGEPFEMTTEKKYIPKELEVILLDWYVKNCWLKEMWKWAVQHIHIKAEYLGSEEGKHKYKIYAEADPEFWIYKNAKDEKEAKNIFKFISSAKEEEKMKKGLFAVRFPGTVKKAIEKKLGEGFEVSYDPNPWIEHETKKIFYEFAIKKKGAVEEKKAEEKAAPQVSAAVEVSTPTVSAAVEEAAELNYATLRKLETEIPGWMKEALKKPSKKEFNCGDKDTAEAVSNYVKLNYEELIKNGTLKVEQKGATVILTTKVAKEEKKPKKEEVKKTEEKKKIVPYSYEYYLRLFKGTEVDKEMEKVKAEKRAELAKKIYDYLPKGFENYSSEEKGKYINYLKTLIPAWVDALNSE